MLATAGPPPTGDGWALEVKWDGIRAQAIFDGRVLCVRSRPGRACTEEFPELQALSEVLRRHRVALDGELVCLGADGKPDFNALRARLGHGGPRTLIASQQRSRATLMVFDILHFDGRAVRALPYRWRRELLDELALDGPAWRTPRNFIGEGEALLAATAKQGLEGVVAKRLDSRYTAGKRSAAWVKTKHRRRERLVVTGWRELGDGRLPEFMLARRGLGGSLRPAGSASLGPDSERRGQLIDALREHELPGRRGRGRSSVRWVVPGPIEVTADSHGRPDGPVRDAVLRHVHLPTDTPA